MEKILELLKPLVTSMVAYFNNANSAIDIAKKAAKIGIELSIKELEEPEKPEMFESYNYNIKQLDKKIQKLDKERNEFVKIKTDSKDTYTGFGSPAWDEKELQEKIDELKAEKIYLELTSIENLKAKEKAYKKRVERHKIKVSRLEAITKLL